MSAVPLRQPRPIARPLPVLVPLIQRALQEAETARLERYREAGALLLEAKASVPHGDWTPWIRKRFKLSERTARLYMQLAQNGNALPFSSLREVRKTLPLPPRRFNGDDAEQISAAAAQIVDSGYKALARRAHPDHGGAAAEMACLNRARVILTRYVRQRAAWS